MPMIVNGVELVAKRSKELTRNVSRVLGNMTYRRALLVERHYEQNSDRVAASALDLSISNFKPEKKTLRYDGMSILIEFSNGNQVLFSNSEWAAMELVEGDIRILD